MRDSILNELITVLSGVYNNKEHWAFIETPDTIIPVLESRADLLRSINKLKKAQAIINSKKENLS